MIKKNTARTMLDKKIEFVINISEDYSLHAEEKTVSFSELEEFIQTNIDLWSSLDKRSQKNDLSNYWLLKKDELSKGLDQACLHNRGEIFKQINEVFSQLGLQHIYEYSEESIKDSTIKIERAIRFDMPSIDDECHLKIFHFAKFAFETLYTSDSLVYLLNAIKEYIYLCKNPQSTLNHIYSNEIYQSIPALYLLREILDFKDKNWNVLSQETLDSYKKILSGQLLLHKAALEETRESLLLVHNDVLNEKQELLALENTYREKLKLEAPEKLWNDQADSYAKTANYYIVMTVLFGFISSVLIGIVLAHVFSFQEYSSWISPTLILVSFISFMLYILRTFIKQFQSSRHLEVTCRERAALTRFYQSLVYQTGKSNSEQKITSDERLLIFQALFTIADSGLVKSDNNSLNADLILSLIKKG